MFVSCNPTVPRNWPNPRLIFLFVYVYHQDFSSDFAHKISFGKKQKTKKVDLPTLTFFGHVTGKKHLFF